MPKKTPKSLPKPLGYLQPFMRFLAKLPRDQLNEELDLSRLESALRMRLRGLDGQRAAEAISKDREQLERWVKTSTSPDHPAHYVLGVLAYLSITDVVQQLIRPPEPPPPRSTISFDGPDGWKMTAHPCDILLKKGKLIAVIMAIEEFSFEVQLEQEKQRPLDYQHGGGPPGLQATRDVTSIHFGDVSGTKYVYRQVSPVPWKRVDYLLRVPGGFARAILDASGADFDEAPFDSKLHTLRVSTPT